MRVSILLVVERKPFRAALGEWLDAVFPTYDVQCAGGVEHLEAIPDEDAPQVIVMHDDIVDMDAVDAIRRIKFALPSAELIVLTEEDQSAIHQAFVEAGATTCVVTWQIASALEQAVEEVIVSAVEGNGL